MPVLISSASGGKKAAPKGAIRRRPAPAPGPATPAQTTDSAPASVAPPSPPPTQPAPVDGPVQEQEAQQPAETVQVQPEPTREPEVEQTPQEPEQQSVPPPTAEPAREPVVEAPAELVREPTPVQTQPQQPETVERVEEAPFPTAEPVQSVIVEPGTNAFSAPVQPAQQPEVHTQQSQESRPQENVPQPVQPTAPTAAPKPVSKRTRNEASTSAAPRPTKRVKRSSARSNATVQARVEGDNEPPARPSNFPTESEEESAAQGTPKATQKRRQTTRKAPTTQRKTRNKAKSAATIVNSDDEGETVQSPDAPEDVESEEPPPRKPKQRRKKKQLRIAEDVEVVEGEGQENGEAEGEVENNEDADESDPELHEIDPNTLSMWDLSHDATHGKTSERGRKMAEIDWDDVTAKRRTAAEAIVSANDPQPAPTSDVVQSTEGPDGTTESQAGDAEQTQGAPAAEQNEEDNNLGFKLDADGNIILDAETLAHDQTADARAAAESGQPIEDDNDLTNTINRATWINDNRREPTDRVPLWKWKSDPWNEDDTDRFYEALTMFGTDFFIISKMFPGKTRRMIKSKFTREEKLDPQRINNALLGKSTKPMDLEHYSRETGRDMSVFTKYEGVEHLQREINESMKDRQEAMTTSIQQEAALAEEKAAKEKADKREKSRTSKKARKKRSAAGTMGGGPEDVSAD